MKIPFNHPKQAVCMNQVSEKAIHILDAFGCISRFRFFSVISGGNIKKKLYKKDID